MSKKKTAKKEKSASEILFPEKVIEGYTIKPWSWGDMEDVSPILEELVYKLMKKGINLDNLVKELPKVLVNIIPEITELLSTVLKVDKEEIRKLNPETVLTMVLTIIAQNMSYLKNSLGPIIDVTKALTQIVPT